VQYPPAPKPAEDLPKPLEVVTPAGPRIRLTIPADATEGVQAWEASSYEEMTLKLYKSIVHANRFLSRQSRELKQVRDVLKSVSRYLMSLSRLRGAEADAELRELQKLVEQQSQGC
jgi:hypothetical protein